MSEEITKKKSPFDSSILSTKVKSANVKIFPEAGLGYFLGPTLALFSNAVLNTYLNKYYTDILKLTDWATTFSILLPLLSVIAIVIGNILVGKLMDRGKTKAGKARPLLLIAFPLIIIAILAMFFNPFAFSNDGTLNEGSVGMLIWIAIAYNLYYAIAYPFYYTSHSALVNLSTRNSSHRGLLGTASMATGLAAVGLTSMVIPFFIGYLFVDTGSGSVNPLASYQAWQVFTIALVVMTGIGILIEYYFTRERITEESFSLAKPQIKEEKKPISTKKQAKACLTDKYWWIIVALFFLYQLGGMLKNNSQLYFCQAWFKGSDGSYSVATGGQYSGTISIIGAIPTALGMVVVWPLSNKIGKAKTIIYGCLLAVLGGLIGFIDPSNFALVVTSFVLKAFGSTPAMYISLALLADVLDHNEAVHGFRSDGLTMTIYGAIMIGMNGVANGIINGLLSATGYDASSAASFASNGVRSAMEWVFLGGEVICYGVMGLLLLFMKVEKFSKLDHEAIKEDQKAEAEKEGVEYVEPVIRLEKEQAQAEIDSEKAYLEELKKKCQKKGLDYTVEEKKYFDNKALKAKQAAEKKQALENKQVLKAKTLAEKASQKEMQRKLNLKEECNAKHLDYEVEEKKYEDNLLQNEKAKAEKQALEDQKLKQVFEGMRKKFQSQSY